MLGVYRLSGDAECVADLLPRPPATACDENLIGLHPLRQPTQRHRGAQSERRVVSDDGRGDVMLVYHFMFGPDWTEGCPVCSYWADGFNGTTVHLNQRDVTMLCASRAPVARLNAYKRRMGWSFPWVSTGRSDFNYDFGVSLRDLDAGASQREMERPTGDRADGATYNFTKQPFAAEMPGLSAFALADGVVYHTYSGYARGLDAFNGANQLLDRAPRGRDEDARPMPVAWLRRHDEYEGQAGA